MSNTTTYHGSCNCGAIEWEAKLTPEQQSHVICHCRDCQKISGGLSTLNQVIPRSALSFTKGEDQLRKYAYPALSGNNTDCFTCATCSASPYHHQHVMGPDTIVLRTSLLDRASEFPVAAEIFCKAMFPFETKLAKDAFDGPPPS